MYTICPEFWSGIVGTDGYNHVPHCKHRVQTCLSHRPSLPDRSDKEIISHLVTNSLTVHYYMVVILTSDCMHNTRLSHLKKVNSCPALEWGHKTVTNLNQHTVSCKNAIERFILNDPRCHYHIPCTSIAIVKKNMLK